MNKELTSYLLKLGFVPNKIGYKYIYEIISLGLCEEILPLKHNAYQKLSDNHSKNVATIEKDIGNAIATAWLKGDIDSIYDEFGETIDAKKGKPSNKQFILTAIDRLKAL